MLGHLLRQFSPLWGMLPLILTAMRAAGMSVINISETSIGGLAAVELEYVNASLPTMVSMRTSHVRYIQADLNSPSNLTELLRLHEIRGRHAVVGSVIKGAEVCFAGASSSDRLTHQLALSRHLLAAVDVLLQSVQTGVRYPLVSDWAARVIPLGTRLLVPDARGRVSELNEVIGLSESAWRTPSWRSLEGVRFGYCRSTANMEQVERNVTSQSGDIPVKGEGYPDELGAPMYCGALLASRSITRPRMSGHGTRG